ncbi:hypothetical protein MASR1M101_10220 [Gemmatimonas sp.]
MASTWLSNQSFTAWLEAQTIGPVNPIPNASVQRRSDESGTPAEIAPQVNAHIGGNQVTGLSNVRTAFGSRRAGAVCSVKLTPIGV